MHIKYALNLHIFTAETGYKIPHGSVNYTPMSMYSYDVKF